MGDDIFAGGSATFSETTGTALLDPSGVWSDIGASSPPPSAQPDFNSPVTQDSMGILDTISTGVDSLSTSLTKILGSATNLQSAAATANAKTQANQLAAQSQSTTSAVLKAQSTAQINAAQVNANISSSLNKLTANPMLIALLVLGFIVLRKVL